MKAELEKVIETEILNFLRHVGIYCWKNERMGTWDAAKGVYRRNNNPHKIRGVSDIIGLIGPGRFLAIEVKSKTGTVSPEQRVFLARINNEGGIAFVARDLAQCISQLQVLFPEHARLHECARDYLDTNFRQH